MKKIYYILICTLTLFCSIKAQQTQTTVPISGNYQEYPPASNSNTAQKSPQDAQLSKILETCKKVGPKSETNDQYQNSISQCIDKEIEKISPQDAQKMLMGDSKTLSGNGLITENKENIRSESDPAYKKLNEYLTKVVEESIRGTTKNNDPTEKEKFVDHEVFYELYKTQITKNFIAVTSSYCINMDMSTGNENYMSWRISNKADERQKQRAQNIADLGDPGGGKNSKKDDNPHVQKLYKCIETIPINCEKFKNMQSDITNDENVYTFGLACVVSKEMRRLKQKQIEITQLKQKIAKYEKSDQNFGMNISEQTQLKGMYQYGNGDKEKTVNELTSISSGAWEKDSGLGKAIQDEIAEFSKNCLNGPLNERCKQLLNNNKDLQRFYAMRQDWNLNTALTTRALRGMNMQQIKEFLQKEGYTDKQIQDYIKQKDAQNIIADRYNNERNALILFMNKRLDKFNAEQGGNTQATAQGPIKADTPENIKSAMNTALDELKKKQSEARDTILYSNLLFSMLPLGDANPAATKSSDPTTSGAAKNKSFVDSTMAWSEFRNSAIDPSKNPNFQFIDPLSKDSFKKIQAGLTPLLTPESKEKSKGSQSSAIEISPETINQLLK